MLLPTQPRARWQVLALGLAMSPLGGLAAQTAGADATDSAMIFRAFPEADSYRRIVRNIGSDARKVIEQRLPFKLHFNELGEHTLFVGFRSRRPVGVVYVRSEETQWGLAEIGWALTLDLRVHGFQFLNGRSLHEGALEASHLPKQLAGRDFTAVVALLANDRDYLSHVAENVAEQATMVVRSAAKALLVTSTVWQDQVERLQDTALGYDAFPSAARFPCQTGQFDLSVGNQQQVVSVKIVGARTSTNHLLGAVIRTESELAGAMTAMTWIIDGRSRVQRVTPTSVVDQTLRLACLQLEGQPLASPPDPDNPLAPLARGLAALVRLKTQGDR